MSDAWRGCSWWTDGRSPATMEFLFVHTLHDSEGQLADFRTQELDSIATLLGAPTPVIADGSRIDSPFVFGRLPSIRHAERLCKRTVLLKSAATPQCTLGRC